MSERVLKVSESNSESSSFEESDDEVDADAESVGSLGSDHDNKEKIAIMTNEGWADSVAKILSTNKPKNKKTIVLSRAKKHSEIVKTEVEEKPTFEIIGETKEKKVKTEIDVPESKIKLKEKKNDKPSIRVKPNILQKDRERLLKKIATKGVVQLFNAVRNQQKTLEKEVERSDLTEGKKEKILKKFDKRAFLDTLMGQSKSINVDENAKSLKKELKLENEETKWNALRDDFMMGAKMKDWDKESVDE